MRFCAVVEAGRAGGAGRAGLESIARACSPRVEMHGDGTVIPGMRAGAIFDASGLSRVLGSARDIAAEVQRLAVERGLTVRVAVTATSTSAWLLAHHSRTSIAVVEPDREAVALAGLPVDALLMVPDLSPLAEDVRRQRVARVRNFRAVPPPVPAEPVTAIGSMRRTNTGGTKEHVQVLTTLARWGIRTLGELAALPRAELHARFGALGVRMHEAAMGQDRQPMVPGGPPRRFVERLALDWPIEGLEPLSFVLARLCESLSTQLEQADRGAVSITTRLALVSKTGYERTLHLPAPMRDPRVLRTLILLDLEAHPIEGRRQKAEGRNKTEGETKREDGKKLEDTSIESAGIDAVELDVEVSPGRIAQGALFVRTVPTPETLSTLVARLGALMGETRVGSPTLGDTDEERATAMTSFVVREISLGVRGTANVVRGTSPAVRALRRLRMAPVVRVRVEHGVPVDVMASTGVSCSAPPARPALFVAGPWRSSGRWWRRDGSAWNRDTWDVEMKAGPLVRVSRNRLTNNWELEGTYD